jgi:hypothetical protein
VLNIERIIEAKARSLFTSLPFAGITRSRFNGFDLSPSFGAPLFLKSTAKLRNLFQTVKIRPDEHKYLNLQKKQA